MLDESGCSQKPSIRRTWALRGQTPIVRHCFNWKRLSVMGALALSPEHEGVRVFLSVKPGSVNRHSVIGFLRSLRRHVRGHVILLWDGLPAHRSRDVERWIEQHRHWLDVERLPAYCPELNPLEYLFENLQANELANYSPDDLDDLEKQIHRGGRRIRHKPQLLKSFLKHSGLFRRV